ncbi:MAG: ATP-binding protein [Bacteroidota bacterium]
MEHLKSYYTIEKHLEESAKFNRQFEILDAIWKLNKRNLSLALSNISQYYPHYSLHEQSHSNTIIKNIESFLGEERIKTLSPTNAWLILMSSYTHDLGMVVFQDLIEKQWLSDEFQDFLKEICDWDDIEMKESGEILTRIQNFSHEKQNSRNEWLFDITPIKIKNSVTLVVAEYIRRIHHKRSADIIKGADKAFFEIANSFYSDQIPSRLLNVLGEVAYLHGVEFYEIFNRLEFESNGISGDTINPRLVACLLRLGDLLDVDDNRFNTFTEHVFQFPKSSISHREKHSSIRHILIKPEAIEIIADCPNEEVYRLARNWFDWLEEEVEKQSKEWSNIAPHDLGGSSPTIPKGKIKVYYNSKITDDKFLNLKFEISNNKIFEILEGSSIYEKAEFTFIRELVQNALDASKIQLWSEIEKGTFDFVFRTELDNKTLTHKEIIDSIKFPNDIPELLYESFEVKLSINWKDDSKTSIVFIVQDSGTGISNSDLLRMTNKVGESRRKNKEYQKMLGRMPFWLKPTGAFGIGLQSVFIITDTFIVETKIDGEQSKEIIFRSAKKGKYSSIGKNQPKMERGTKVIVEVPKNRFPDIFGTSFDWDIITSYDYFTDKHKSIYIPKIKKYIDEILPNVRALNVDFFGENLFIKKSQEGLFKSFGTIQSKDFKIQCRLRLRANNFFFEFYENIIGSEFCIRFLTSVEADIDNRWALHETKYFVRDIPVKDNVVQYYKLNYSKLYWNFMSPESDKILSLTREKFITKNKQKLQSQFLNEVLPPSVELLETTFLQNIEEVKKYFGSSKFALAYGYFKILLTKTINNIKGAKINNSILGNAVLQSEMIEYLNGEAVKMKDFFSCKTLIVPLNARPGVIKSKEVELKRVLLKRVSNKYDKNAIVVFNIEFFTQYILNKYNIQEIVFHEDGNILVLSTEEESITIVSGETIYLEKLLKSPGISKRGLYYSNEKYDKYLAIQNQYATGFEHFPYLSNKSIISPFKDLEEYKSIKEKLSGSKDLNKILTNDFLSGFITDSLIDWVIENKPNGSVVRNKETILNAYKDLIIAFIENDI